MYTKYVKVWSCTRTDVHIYNKELFWLGVLVGNQPTSKTATREWLSLAGLSTITKKKTKTTP